MDDNTLRRIRLFKPGDMIHWKSEGFPKGITHITARLASMCDESATIETAPDKFIGVSIDEIHPIPYTPEPTLSEVKRNRPGAWTK